VKRLAAALVAVLLAVLLVPAPEIGGDRPFLPPASRHLLGTDGQGQDVLSLLVHGAPTTLGIGLASGLGMVALGAAVALVAAVWPRARPATELATVVFLALPGLPLMVLLAAWMPPGPLTMVAVLVLTGWPWHARVLAASARVVAAQPWVEAARLAGESSWRLACVEILPSLSPMLLAGWLGASAYAVGAEVGLEYVGLGDLDADTWGTTLYWAANDAALIVGAWWVFVPVGTCIGLVALALLVASRRVGAWMDPGVAAVARHREQVAAGALPRMARGPDGGDDALRIVGLRVGFVSADGVREVVHGVDLTVARGEILGLVGASGGGKSVLMAAALGILPSPGVVLGGSVSVGGRGVVAGELLPRSMRGPVVAWIPQAAQAALHPSHTVAEVLRESLRAHGKADDAQVLLQALDRVKLSPSVLSLRPGELSGGMRQRVVLAAGLLHAPSIVVLDEPTTALDPDVARQILDDLAALQQQLGFALVLVSHDAGVVRRYAHRVVALADGLLVTPVSPAPPTVDRPTALTAAGPIVAELCCVSGPAGLNLVRDVDLVLRAGEVTAIIGPSGSGKTTIARLIAGLSKATRGEVRRPDRVAMVHQDPFTALHPQLPARHGVVRALRLTGRAAADADGLLAAVHLDAASGDRPPGGLSGGQRQRVAIARAMASSPALWVADEPTAMLDAATREALLDELIQAVRASGAALLLVTHDLDAVLPRADRLVVVDGGRVVEQGPRQDVLTAPQHQTTQRLLAGREG
jgi:peptide/nickel transport system permease protein